MSPTDERAPIHRYHTHVEWSGSTADGYDAYDRSHRATTDPATVELAMSGDPAFHGDPSRLNPEQLLVLAASSCQMLSFLAVAARARLDVISYADDAEGTMPEDDHPLRITTIALRPRVEVRAPSDRADFDPGALDARVRHLLDVGHRHCFIASSLNSAMTIEPTIVIV